ncbi:GntR family transcriptional regulator [Rhizobiaceae bacterium n13]|uniref:GntR family transcriptional regulator n=1 Tax=Ferirhizobium litorale TaxID=2927786 RepID=A0AAE3QAL3_9HYPH|nr:GntR family transcriptional regulator [Fererhizobium litorale]MDI7863491.1 GntR family transcriptional regulator [Fererhizobium litorale]MDI7922232.1 GntR family transcriptional regulator [Fererhizobium litorale]
MFVPETKQPSESVRQWVYRRLRYAIMTGHFPPGRAVTINGIAEMLDVSAMPVREALHRLVADGALEHLDNRRVRVPPVDPDKFDEMIAARIALETIAAERAIHFIDYIRFAELQKLDAACDEAYAAGNIELGIERNFAFHRCLYEVRSSAVLLPLIESTWLRLGPFMREATENLHESYLVDRHAEALEAIRARDAEALKAAIAADIQDGAGHLGRRQFLDAAARSAAAGI